MTGKRLVQTLSKNKFIDEAFIERNARGKRHSFAKSCLKKASRKIRRNRAYLHDAD